MFCTGHKPIITGYAKKYKWTRVKTADPFLVSFEKGDGNDWQRINVWSNKKSSYYTVGTCLNHPKQGKTQLFRKHVSIVELENYFEKPRVHTNKGYKRK